MKRALSLLLVMCTMLSLGAFSCLAAETGPEQTVELGQALPLDFAELAFDEVKLLPKVDSSYSVKSEDGKSSGSAGVSLFPPEGMTFFGLVGTIKNTDSAEYSMNALVGEAVFDGETSYPLSVRVAANGSFLPTLAPLASGTIYIFARIPDDLAASFTSCRFCFGMEDRFAEPVPETAAECANTFVYDMQREGSDLSAASGAGMPAPVENLAIGDAINLDFVQMTVDAIGVKDSLQISSKSSGLSITSGPSAIDGKQYVYVQGKFKNLAKQAVQPKAIGSVEIDGYTYQLKSTLIRADASPSFQVDPLEEVTYMLYASVPVELTSNFQSCTMRFGFNDEFASDFFTEFNDCTYRYQCSLTAGN